MPSSPAPSTRDLATAAYAHACAVLGASLAATEAAILGLRKGGRSLAMVLGHTRAAALERARGARPFDAASTPIPSDLPELARLLVCTRPAVERALVDLAGRHALDPAALGRAVGLPPGTAASRAAGVALAWQRDLDPIVLAHLGPGTCAELASVLAGVAQASPEAGEDAAPCLTDLIDAGLLVAVHAEECDICRDRLRAMVSIRTLIAQIPMEEPPGDVRAAAAVARLRPSGPPPPLAGGATPIPRRPWPVLAAACGAIVVAVGGGIVVAARDREDGPDREALARSASSSAEVLAVTPSLVTSPPPTRLVVRNLASREVSWEATVDIAWLVADPSSGTLQRGETARVRLTPTNAAPEGDVRAAVTFTTKEGSTTVARLRTTLGQPPDVAVEIAGCAITASVEDESELQSVVLHWTEPPARTGQRPAERAAAMTKGEVAGTWEGTLASTGIDKRWWVTATDAFENEARTQEEVAPGANC